MLKSIGALTIFIKDVENGDKAVFISSYEKDILYFSDMRDTRNEFSEMKEQFSDYAQFDDFYYSQTTRKHQGIALSILRFISIYGIDNFYFGLKRVRIKSQKDLIHYFGYIPRKEWNAEIIKIKSRGIDFKFCNVI